MRRSNRMGAAAWHGRYCGAILLTAPPMLRSLRANGCRIAHSLRGGGCTFTEDPARSCAEVTPIWSADVDPCVLQVRCEPTTDRDPLAIDLARYDVRSVAGAHAAHLSISSDQQIIRIDVIAGKPTGLVSMRPMVDLHKGVECQVMLLRCLDGLLRGRRIPRRGDARLKRLILALRVGDALTAGASLRLIGMEVLGFRDWPGDGDCAKSSTRRIVELARALLEAGPLGIFSSSV